MKSLALIFSGLLLAAAALAQHGGGGHSGGGGHTGGGHWSGGGGHTGGGGGFHAGAGGFHGGGGSHSGAVSGRGGYGYGGRGYYGGAILVPYAVPYAVPYYGYGGAPAYDSGYNDAGSDYSAPAAAPPPEQPADNGPAASYGPGGGQPEPPPQYGDNALPMYQAPAPSPQDQAMAEGRYYLIAYKDHSIYTALAYWMENGVLNYVTPQNAHNQVSLNLLDVDLTKQLNARRGMAFNIVNQ